MDGLTAFAARGSAPHRVLIVDDRPELRLLIRSRLRMLPDIDIVGEASNGAEALVLVSALAPDALVLDLDMPVMNGDEAIPRLRALRPGLRILLYAADATRVDRLGEAAQPDAVVMKGRPLGELVDELRALLAMSPFDVLRVVLAPLPLEEAVTAYDTWVGLGVRILESLVRDDQLVRNQLGGTTIEELQALMGLYAHLGDNIRRAVERNADEVVPIIHILRAAAAAARRALLALDDIKLQGLYAVCAYDVSGTAAAAVDVMRARLIDALPTSSADPFDSAGPGVEMAGRRRGGDRDESPGDRAVASVDRAAAAIDRAAAAQDRAAASLDELTGTYLRGPGHVELKREMARARRTREPLTLAFLDVDGLKVVNDSRGHDAGDRLLRDVAAALREQTREYDVIVRHGGDEFLCALPGMSLEEASARMDLIHRSSPLGPTGWSVSAGLALLHEDDTLESLISRADAALYSRRARTTAPAAGA